MATHSHGPHEHHDHGHGHDHHGHDHHHHHDDAPPSAAEIAVLKSDPAQESLVAALRTGFGVLKILMLVLVAAYVFSGVFRVTNSEQALVVRLGRLQAASGGTLVHEPGTHFRLPDPFSKVLVLPKDAAAPKVLVTSFAFEAAQRDVGKPLSELRAQSQALRVGVDGALLSGDKNLSHGRFTVQYRITDAARFVQNVADQTAAFEKLLGRLTEFCVVREVGGRRVEEVTREASSIGFAVQSRLQRELDALDAGVVIDKVLADTTEPGPVAEAFNDVGAAENDSKKSINEAEQRTAQTLNEAAGAAYPALLEKIDEYAASQARGDDLERQRAVLAEIDTLLDGAGGTVARLLSAARTAAVDEFEGLQREYEEFRFYREQYRKFPAITRLDMWVRMRQAVLGSRQNEIFFLPQTGMVDLWMNRDPVRQRELEEEDIKAELRGEKK